MILGLSLENLLSWMLQVVLVASAGAVLPMLFRIRHPRSQLIYYHAVLVLCFVLPVIQPWEDSLTLVIPRSFEGSPEVAAISWSIAIKGILALGILAKLCWLGVGLWQLRRFRKFAIPISPVPESIREASRLTGADALFCLSRHVAGPATVGHIDPIVLVPESFESLDRESQQSIACHELLHVRRRDWLVTICEELVIALLWFNPGIWWLLAQAKLSREQLVDSEVVKLTSREPYVKALLSMAVPSKGRWALPAASFFTRGHLIQRMRLLLMESKRSFLGLCASYAVLGSVLALTLCGAFVALPLANEAQAVTLFRVRGPQFVLRFERLEMAYPQHPEDFDLPVPAPFGPARDFQYDVRVPAPQGLLENTDPIFLPLPPPPPPPPPPGTAFGFLQARGVAMLRPGTVVSAEEIERLRKALGDRVELSVHQAEDGTIVKVMVGPRRFSNEANSVPTGVPSPSTESSDRID